MPKATTIAVLMAPDGGESELRDVQAAAQGIGQQLIILNVGSDRDIETAFAGLAQRGVSALLLPMQDGLFLSVGFLAAIILIGLGSAAVWGTIVGAVFISA
jgi:hypothetical protein